MASDPRSILMDQEVSRLDWSEKMSIDLKIQDLAQKSMDLLQLFRDAPVANLSDCMHRLHGATDLKKYHRGGSLLGRALTVKTRPGDNLMLHKALSLAKPGDVLVVDGGGDISRALVGEIMLRLAESRCLAGFVIDGAIRDVLAYRNSDFPCYARGHTHVGPYKDGPGFINVPVAIGNFVVNPNDIIVGDDDGIIAFPESQALFLHEKMHSLREAEKDKLDAIRDGNYDESWIDECLRLKISNSIK